MSLQPVTVKLLTTTPAKDEVGSSISTKKRSGSDNFTETSSCSCISSCFKSFGAFSVFGAFGPASSVMNTLSIS